MFRFEDPAYLYLLAVVPVLALIRYLTGLRQRRRLRKFGDLNLLKELMPDVSGWRPAVKFWLLEAVLALLIIVMARPQMGTRITTDKRVGIETVIAMDISNSMLAEDVSPSRLDRSKMLVEDLVDNFSNDKIGLIVFAGEAFVQLPITSDFVSAKMFLNNITPSLIEAQGTDIATAINMASHSFTQQEGVGKAIIVITDGEDHEGGAVEAAEQARKKGMNVFVLGIGSAGGAPIKTADGTGYITDNTGNTVMSVLNEDMCKEIAVAGNGAYIHVDNNSNAQERLSKELDKLAKSEISSSVYSDYDEQFQVFCIIAALLLLIEVCLMERKNRRFRNIKLFGRRTAGLLLLFAVPVVGTYGQSERGYIRSGNKQYRSKNYPEAEISYRKAIEKNRDNAQAVYNLGNALLLQQKDSAAIRQFEQSAKMEKNPLRKAKSFHNIGVICQGHKMFAEAIAAYKDALRLNPNDDETRYNLELCKRQLKQQKQDDKKDKNKEQDNKDKQDKNKEEKQKQEKDKQQKQEEQQKDNKMSKENAEQLLNAAMQQERNTQQRMKKAMQPQRSRRLQKNW